MYYFPTLNNINIQDYFLNNLKFTITSVHHHQWSTLKNSSLHLQIPGNTQCNTTYLYSFHFTDKLLTTYNW